jgi:hypothetical protein
MSRQLFLPFRQFEISWDNVAVVLASSAKQITTEAASIPAIGFAATVFAQAVDIGLVGDGEPKFINKLPSPSKTCFLVSRPRQRQRMGRAPPMAPMKCNSNRSRNVRKLLNRSQTASISSLRWRKGLQHFISFHHDYRGRYDQSSSATNWRIFRSPQRFLRVLSVRSMMFDAHDIADRLDNHDAVLGLRGGTSGSCRASRRL